MTRITMLLALSVVLCVFGNRAHADEIELEDGSTFSSISTERFDGANGRFQMGRRNRSARIGANEVGSIRFASQMGSLTLIDGSVYSPVRILGYSGEGDTFSVERNGQVVEIAASEIAEIDFFSPSENPVSLGVASATDLLNEDAELKGRFLEQRGLEDPPAEEEILSEEELLERAERRQEAREERPERRGERRSRREGRRGEIDLDDEEETSALTKGWTDDELYSNLEEGFGRRGENEEEGPPRYVARWREEGANRHSEAGGGGSKRSEKASLTSGPRAGKRDGVRPRGGGRGSGNRSDRSAARSGRNSRDDRSDQAEKGSRERGSSSDRSRGGGRLGENGGGGGFGRNGGAAGGKSGRPSSRGFGPEGF